MRPTPQQFLERVVPWPDPSGPGYVNLHWTKDGRWRGRPFKDVASLIDYAQRITPTTKQADDIYFCMSMQREHGKVFRRNQNVLVTAKKSKPGAMGVRALWLDVDVKAPPKGYATLIEAIDAVDEFCKAVNLPAPTALVHSGGGLHVYWVFDRVLTPQEWFAYAEGLKAEAIRFGLRADHGVTADIARVLRVPGTFNRKIKDNPRPVKLLYLKDDYPADRFEHLRAIGAERAATVTATVTTGPSAPPFDISQFVGKAPSPLLAHLDPQEDNLADGLNVWRDMPLDPTNIFKQCQHYRETLRTGGAGQGQGLWMLTVLGSVWFQNGPEIARQLSNGYPNYSDEETDAMFVRKTEDRAKGVGWPSCAKLEGEGAKCAGCPMRGLIKSPLNLAERMTPPRELIKTPTNIATYMPMPENYEVHNGVVCRMVEVENLETGEWVPKPVELFHGRITDPWLEGGRNLALHFLYHVGTSTYDVKVPDGAMAQDSALFACITPQGVKTKTFQEKYVRDFMKSWATLIEEEQNRRSSQPFGWVEDGGRRVGFAYAGKYYKEDGTVLPCGMPDPEIASIYRPRGSEAQIMKLIEIITARKHPALEVLTLQAFAGPLLVITGEDSAMMWAYSIESAAHKSTSLLTGLAVWADPRRAKENALATTKGLQAKMHQLRHIPIAMDEIGREGQVEDVFPHVNMLTEGTDGSASRRDRTVAQKREWQTILTCCANKSMREYILSTKTGTDAQMVRVFEFLVDKIDGPNDGIDVRSTVDELCFNFGHLGIKYAEFLGKNYSMLKARLEVISKEFQAKVGGKYDDRERFWRALCVITILGAENANHILGKPMFDVQGVTDFLVTAYLDNRKFLQDYVVKENTVMSYEEMLRQFLQERINNQAWTDTTSLGSGRAAVKCLRWPPENAYKAHPLYVRWCVEDKTCLISKAALTKFIQENLKKGGASAVNGIIRHFGARVLEKKILAANITGIKAIFPGPRETVIEIPVPAGSFLYDTLMAYTEAPDPAVTAAVTPPPEEATP